MTYVGVPEPRWYLRRDSLDPLFYVTYVGWPVRCGIPVLPGGDGADSAPLSDRTAKCQHRTTLIVGAAPTCGHHFRVACRIAGVAPEGFVPECPL